MRSKVVKLGVLSDPLAEDQINNILGGLLPFLGFRATDPTTTGWGPDDVCCWLRWTSTMASARVSCAIKYWNGKAVKTVTAT